MPPKNRFNRLPGQLPREPPQTVISSCNEKVPFDRTHCRASKGTTRKEATRPDCDTVRRLHSGQKWGRIDSNSDGRYQTIDRRDINRTVDCDGRQTKMVLSRVHDRIRHEGVRRSCSSSGCVWYRQKVKLETLESGRGSGQSTVGKAQLMVSIWGAGITEWYVRSDTDRGFRRYARTMIGNSLVVTEQALPQ
jgi:hypothetical protein